MKIIIILMIAMTASASARIGETMAECTKRYGSSIKTVDNQTVWKKAGFIIYVQFYKNTAHSILFEKEDKDELGNNKTISKTEIKALLESNFGKEQLTEVELNALEIGYHNKNTSRLAIHNTLKNFLIISTMEYKKKQQAEEAKEEKEALKGF